MAFISATIMIKLWFNPNPPHIVRPWIRCFTMLKRNKQQTKRTKFPATIRNLELETISADEDLSSNYKHRRSAVGRAPAGNWMKVAGSMLESGNSSLCPWERHFTLMSFWGHAVYPSWRPSPTKYMQTEPQKGCPVLARKTYAGCLVHANERKKQAPL